MASSTNLTQELSPANSSKLALLHPTQEEKIATWVMNGQMWRGRLSIPEYLRREQHLEDQAFTRNGGITFWILVDSRAPANDRTIIASCESLKKRALIARENGQVEDIISHGVGSVFCNPEFRRRGYAQRMLAELAEKLNSWQQQDGRRAEFSVLYSDIGKHFYSKLDWKVFPSSHISLPPISNRILDLVQTEPRTLYAHDLARLCALDEKNLRAEMARPTLGESKIRVALIPDIDTIRWHHAREEFAAKTTLGSDPDVKGAYVKTRNGHEVWCVWTRTFGNDEASNTLNVLRFVVADNESLTVEKPETSKHSTSFVSAKEEQIQAATAILRAAQYEAAEWKMRDVQIWSPSPLLVSAARNIEPSSQVTHRDEESIASLRWHGINVEDHKKVEWVGNEKYGWC